MANYGGKKVSNKTIFSSFPQRYSMRGGRLYMTVSGLGENRTEIKPPAIHFYELLSITIDDFYFASHRQNTMNVGTLGFLLVMS